MKVGFTVLASILLIGLAACSSSNSDLRYLDSRVLPALEIPPDLTTVQSESAFELPAVFSGDSDDPDARKNIPVLANVESIKLEGSGDFYWLNLKSPVDDLYQLLREFWASEGFTLALDEPVIGIMETDWVYREEGKKKEKKGFFASLLLTDDLSASQDQFRTRISRSENEQEVNIYVSHRATEINYKLQTKQNEDDPISKWNLSQSNSELEIEMLSRLMVYLGLRRAEVEQQLENVKLFSSRASFLTDYVDDESYLLVKGGHSRTWNRVLHQLDRLNMEVVVANFKSGISKKSNMLVNTNFDTQVKKKGFFSLFSSKTETVKKQITLIFSEETPNTTRISIKTAEGEVENSSEAIQFLSLLYQHIK